MKLKPDNLSAAKGNSRGEINLQWDSVESAVSYVIEFSRTIQTRDQKWRILDIISDPHYTVRNLISNKDYLFRIISVDKNGRTEPSSGILKKAP
ncbi:MAG TPA: fibronectin type III domain-containing protein [Ignavibacteria bacterium]|nr:fibronectin type III domain-containing protein [Ignavibacteria bacterium]HMR39798.1 fibronectin type III domain-containing protein [Ignavibacteria bacterium]